MAACPVPARLNWHIKEKEGETNENHGRYNNSIAASEHMKDGRMEGPQYQRKKQTTKASSKGTL